MQITDVRVRKVAKEGKLKAVVSITMDEEFVVHDIKVIEGEKGLFIAMPSKKALDVTAARLSTDIAIFFRLAAACTLISSFPTLLCTLILENKIHFLPTLSLNNAFNSLSLIPSFSLTFVLPVTAVSYAAPAIIFLS